MSLTLITATKQRPECFALLERWYRSQTLQPDNWLVVCEGKTNGYRFTCGQTVIKTKEKQDGGESLCQNVKAALAKVDTEHCVCWDDDDYYHPVMLKTLVPLLKDFELVGLSNALYYNIRKRVFRHVNNIDFACLGASAFRTSLVPALLELTKTGTVNLDVQLWRGPASKVLLANRAKDGRPLHIGFKMMPGANNLGDGCDHGSPDKSLTLLRQWLRGDYSAYHELARAPVPPVATIPA
jgi:hypothetical protein